MPSRSNVARLRSGTNPLLLVAAGLLVCLPPAHAEDWLPIDPQELAQTSEPKAPDAPAIYLYRQVDRNDDVHNEHTYLRIKILNEAGRRYANVSIPFDENRESITGIEARTIRRDGTIVPFDGRTFEQPLVRNRGVRIMSKTFALPDVDVGGIIEYRYRRVMDYRFVYNSSWLLSDELFTRLGRFSLYASPQYRLRYTAPLGLPAGAELSKPVNGRMTLEVHDVPAFVSEEFMPPESALKFRVDFIYESEALEKSPDLFWKHHAAAAYHGVEKFIDHRGAMEAALREIIDPADPPRLKLEKIYARVQRIRNVNFERRKSQAEMEREAVLASDDAGDVWKRGYGSRDQITWLFLALLRTAGLDADPVEISTRNDFIFDPQLMNARLLNGRIVRIRLDGQEIYADPGTPFAPLGVLPWHETGVSGIVLAKDGGEWIRTPVPTATSSHIERRATLQLAPDGSLEGRLEVTWSGLEALTRRIQERNEDATERTRYLEGEIKSDVPVGVDLDLTRAPDWESSTATMVAEWNFRVRGWATPAGSRLLLPAALFGAEEKRMFIPEARLHAVVLPFPYSIDDVVTISLPSELDAPSVPTPTLIDHSAIVYRMQVDKVEGKLQILRHLRIDGAFFPLKYYDPLREFFQEVRNGDGLEVVLSRAPVKTAAAH